MTLGDTALNSRLRPWWVLGFALVGTLVCLFPTLQNEWLNWDDDAYVLQNPMVWELTGESIAKMFTTPEQVGLYHPLTMLSLAVDEFIWGREAFGYHLTNLLFHLLNVALVFLLLRKWKLEILPAGLGALLFGMHPMHVESVAWISTRKDVLYTCFFLLALLAYLRYTQGSSRPYAWLALVLGLFACSILSKAIAFVFPVILLLQDYQSKRAWSWKLLWEKLPFFIVAGLALKIATSGQQESDSMVGLASYPWTQTPFIGARNLWIYLGHALVPWKLSPFHPFTFYGGVQIAWWYYLAGAGLLLSGLTAWRFRLWKHWPGITFGLLFFLVCIGPFLQILPYGKAITAERYSYLSYLGLFYALALAWQKGLARFTGTQRMLLLGGTSVWLLFLGIQTFTYAKDWRDGESLWSQVIDQYPDHYYAYLSRGQWRSHQGQTDMALADLDRSLSLNKAVGPTHYERGLISEGRGDWQGAWNHYDQAILYAPRFAKPYVNRGKLRAVHKKDLTGAEQDFNGAISADPQYALAFLNRGLVRRMQGNVPGAEADYGQAVALEPWNTVFLRYRGSFFQQEGRLAEAEQDFQKAVDLDPDWAEHWFLRGRVRSLQGNKAGAQADFTRAQEMGFIFPEGFSPEQ